MKKRRSSPNKTPQREANRAERRAVRKKVAVAASLAATLHGVRVASQGGLLQRAREYAPKAVPKRDNWFSRLERTQPDTATDLRAIAVDWWTGGEMRDLYPTMSALHRFVAAEVTDIERNAFDRWMASVRDAVQ